MRERVTTPAATRNQLVLDCGVARQAGSHRLTFDERGMSFLSEREFLPGTQLAVVCQCGCALAGRRTVPIEGIVAWSEKHLRPVDQAPVFKTTVLFLELPDDLRESLREFSHRLASDT